METDLDNHGGYTVYQNGVPLMRWYYRDFDNAKIFYDIIYLNVDPAIREDTLLDKIWAEDITGGKTELGGDFYIRNHLTGTCIPNDKYIVSGGWDVGLVVMVLYLSLREFRPKIPEFPSFFYRIKIYIKNFLTGINIFFKSLKYLSISKLYHQILCDNVRNYLSTQEFAVIDLRRGEFEYYMNDGKNKRYIVNLGIDSLNDQCPLKKEYLEHIKSFAIALPGKCNSKTYHQLRSYIASDKVIEVTIFRPQDINEIIEYQNIERLYLLYATQELDLKGIESFTKLKKIFISGDIELTEREELKQLRNKIDIEFAIIGEGYYKGAINTKFIQWSCTCPRDVK
jgi:hypothetical protein